MRCRTLLGFALTLVWAASLHAQTPAWVNDILAAARLPVIADEARQEGTTSQEVRSVIEAMSRARVPAHEAAAVLDSSRAARRQHGAVDNFGAFVQSQLAQGKRGRDLAAAIRAEHARAGRGNPGRPGTGAGQGTEDDDDDKDRGRSKADAARERGKSDAARGRGKSDDARERDKSDDARERGRADSARGRDARPARADSARANPANRGQGKGRPATPDR